MLQVNQHYEPEFKKKIVRLHLEEGRSLKGLAAEYGVSHASISNWTNVQYKHVRPHFYNNYKTPYGARYGVA